MSKSFHDLKVWQQSLDLSVLIYHLTEGFPKHELYGLTSQMRRAAVSIASNIAGGAARETRRDFRHFVIMACGGSCELQTQLMIASRLGYGTEAQLNTAEIQAAEVGRLLNGLARFLKLKIEQDTNQPQNPKH